MDPSDDDRVFRPTDKASIALLRRLRAGDHDVPHFVHRVDVCDAVPELLVAHLEPVPGTGLDDRGYSSVWYFYYAKQYNNSRGDTSGHRKRAVTGGGGAGWHSEISPKDVQGSGGGTFCKLSYGRKTNPSARSIDRMGWCMTEYDFPDASADAASNYVLCKVYRSPRAKGKPASASSSNKQTAKKRKARGGEHPEAAPAKAASTSIQQQEQQVQHEADLCDFNFNIEDLNFYLDDSMLQQPTAALEHNASRFIQEVPCVGDLLGSETALQPGAESEHEHGDQDLEEFTVEWFLRGEQQQPIVEPPPGQGGEFIQMPCGPVVPETTVEDMLGLGAPETVYGQWNGGMTTACIPPWSSYSPAISSSYAGCSSLLQGPDPLLLPYLTC